MAKKSKLTDAPDWVVRAAKTGAAIVRPGAAFTAAAATFAGVALEGVSNALGTRRLHGELTITNQEKMWRLELFSH